MRSSLDGVRRVVWSLLWCRRRSVVRSQSVITSKQESGKIICEEIKQSNKQSTPSDLSRKRESEREGERERGTKYTRDVQHDTLYDMKKTIKDQPIQPASRSVDRFSQRERRARYKM